MSSTRFITFFSAGLGVGLYDRKNNTFLIKFKNSQEFIKKSNNTFTDFYKAFTKQK